MNIVKSIILWFAISFFFTSCLKKEEFNTVKIQEINPGWGVPLLDTRLEFKDVIAILDSNVGIREEQDKSYTFYYYDTIVTPHAEEVFQLPDQSYSKVIPSVFAPAITFPAGTELSSNFSQKETFDAGNGSSLKYINLKSGQLSLSISSIFKNKITLELTLFSLLDANQKPFVKTYEMSEGKPFIPDQLNLQGYTLQLSENSGETNAFRYSAKYTLTSTGQPLASGDGLFISLNLKMLKYRLMVGDIGEIKFPAYAGNVAIKAFDQTTFGNIYFSQAKLNLTFNNSLGIPINFTINKLRSYTSYGKSVDITPVNPPFRIDLLAPSLAEQGTFKSKNVVLDNNNSRIVDAINPAPNNIEYDLSTEIVHGSDNFILDQSQVKVYARIDIPLKGYVSKYELSDTTAIKTIPERTFSEDNISGSVDSVAFKLKIENGIPANALTQLYILDKTFKRIDSLLIRPDLILASDHVDPITGSVTAPTTRETVISVNAFRYEKIRQNGKYFNIFSRIQTTNDPVSGKPINIKLESSNSLRVVISVMTKGKIKIE